MTKRELIDEIVAINHTANPQFLARFQDAELDEYLAHLRVLSRPRLSGDAERYAKYFVNCPKAAPARPLWRTDSDRIEQILVNDPRAVQAPAPAPVAAAIAVIEAPPAEHDDEEELTCMSVSPAEREQLLADLDDAALTDDQADDLEVAPEQRDYIPETPLAPAPAVESLAADDALPQDEDDDYLAEDDGADAFTDYTIDCDSDPEQAPQADYAPVAAQPAAQGEPAGVAADEPAARPGTRRDESENWLF